MKHRYSILKLLLAFGLCMGSAGLLMADCGIYSAEDGASDLMGEAVMDDTPVLSGIEEAKQSYDCYEDVKNGEPVIPGTKTKTEQSEQQTLSDVMDDAQSQEAVNEALDAAEGAEKESVGQKAVEAKKAKSND